MNLGFGEMILIFLVVLLLFGAKRLPEVGRSLGQAWHEFQSGMKGGSEGDSKSKGQEGQSSKKV